MAESDPRAYRPASVIRGPRDTEIELAPPATVVQVARSTMGAIDLDPFSTPTANLLVGATNIYDRTIQDHTYVISRDWATRGGRVLLAPTGKLGVIRGLANKCLREYRKGNVKEAVIWIANSEAIIGLPWIWDNPVCIPFRRLRPSYYHEELEKYVSVSPSRWSAIVYLPPMEDPAKNFHAVSLFNVACNSVGRIVNDSGDTEWESGYKALTGKPYSLMN